MRRRNCVCPRLAAETRYEDAVDFRINMIQDKSRQNRSGQSESIINWRICSLSGTDGGIQVKRAAIITSSDTGYRGEREDLSGPAIREILEREGYEVVSMDLLPDDREILAGRMAEIADSGEAELILTTGGTGFSQRDVMPEATEDIIERRVPGIPEAIRAYSMTITKRAMLSRATAGIRKKTLIINLPGSPKAVRESLEYIVDSLAHGIEILTGEATDCARK